MSDLYADLGVDRSADEKTIRSAYRRKAKKTHPDAGGDREAFERAAVAKNVLLDPRRRAKYDETGEVDNDPDNGLAQIMSLVMNALDEALSGCHRSNEDPIKVDLLGKAVGVVKTQIWTGEQNLRAAEIGAKRLRKVAERMKVKKGENRIKPLLDARVVDLDRRVGDIGRQVDQAKSALAMLMDHDFDFERPKAPPQHLNQVNWGDVPQFFRVLR